MELNPGRFRTALVGLGLMALGLAIAELNDGRSLANVFGWSLLIFGLFIVFTGWGKEAS